ncbi:histidine kinase [Streptomyces phaeochromogenes]|uniref:sensor histidine kinase n=1 Tax=Streptomyces phaeochromogenes TaxID=1923 RepID=UPI0033E6E978
MSGAAEQLTSTWVGEFDGRTAGVPVTRHAFRTAFAITAGFVPLGAAAIATTHPGRGTAAAAVGALLGTYVLHLVTGRVRERRRALTIAAQGLLGFLPALTPVAVWPGTAGYFAGALLVNFRGSGGRSLAALAVAAICAAGRAESADWTDGLYAGAVTGATALVLLGAARFVELVTAAHDERETLAWRAVEQERRRYARDLHDLLGYSLSAITLKGDLALRLVLVQPDRTREELDGLLGVAREALADVRAVARGYRELSLAVEAESARSLLAAAGIRTGLDVRCGRDGPVGTVLATVLREGVTNLIRHSKATECRIEIREVEGAFVRLTLSNDGVGADVGALRGCGGGVRGGLDNLAERMEAVGGRLTAGTDERGWYRVIAEAPCGDV